MCEIVLKCNSQNFFQKKVNANLGGLHNVVMLFQKKTANFEINVGPFLPEEIRKRWFKELFLTSKDIEEDLEALESCLGMATKPFCHYMALIYLILCSYI